MNSYNNNFPAVDGYMPIPIQQQCFCGGVFRQCRFCGNHGVNMIDLIIHGSHFTFCTLECLNRMIYCDLNGVLRIVDNPPYATRQLFNNKARGNKRKFNQRPRFNRRRQVQATQEPQIKFDDCKLNWADQVELENK